SAHWQPAFVPVLAEFVGRQLLPGSATSAPPEVNWGDERFRALATFLNAHLRGRRFLVGDELTLADFSVAAMMMYVGGAKFPFDVFTEIDAWYGRIESLEAWRATVTGPWRIVERHQGGVTNAHAKPVGPKGPSPRRASAAADQV